MKIHMGVTGQEAASQEIHKANRIEKRAPVALRLRDSFRKSKPHGNRWKDGGVVGLKSHNWVLVPGMVNMPCGGT